MEGRRTDPALLILIVAVVRYIEAKNAPVNPFVKGFGITEKEHAAFEDLVLALEDCSMYLPEVEEMLDAFDESTSKEESQTLEESL